jgi:hypothetical protein
VSDFLSEKHREISARLNKLKPLVDEYNRLEDAASALAKVIGSAASEATSAVAATVTHRRKRGRPRSSGPVKRASKAVTAATPIEAPRKKRGRPPGRPKVATRTAAPTAGPRRAGRRKGGKRAGQALALIRANPGITVPEMAKKIGIDGTYLYKVLPPLEQEGKIRKDGRGWFPKER